MRSGNPFQLFSKKFSRTLFHGILITRQDGGVFLLPIHEIMWVAATRLETGGCVEIQTRQRLIRLGLTQMDACAQFMDMLFDGDVNHIAEGTAPVSDRKANQNVTLVVEIIETESGHGTDSPSPHATAPAPASRGMGLGFPSF